MRHSTNFRRPSTRTILASAVSGTLCGVGRAPRRHLAGPHALALRSPVPTSRPTLSGSHTHAPSSRPRTHAFPRSRTHASVLPRSHLSRPFTALAPRLVSSLVRVAALGANRFVPRLRSRAACGLRRGPQTASRWLSPRLGALTADELSASALRSGPPSRPVLGLRLPIVLGRVRGQASVGRRDAVNGDEGPSLVRSSAVFMFSRWDLAAANRGGVRDVSSRLGRLAEAVPVEWLRAVQADERTKRMSGLSG